MHLKIRRGGSQIPTFRISTCSWTPFIIRIMGLCAVGHRQGNHYFVFGARTANPTFCSLSDEGPSREGPERRVGQNPVKLHWPRRRKLWPQTGADRYLAGYGGPEHTGDTTRAQDTVSGFCLGQVPYRQRFRLTQTVHLSCFRLCCCYHCCCLTQRSPLAGGADLAGTHVLVIDIVGPVVADFPGLQASSLSTSQNGILDCRRAVLKDCGGKH